MVLDGLLLLAFEGNVGSAWEHDDGEGVVSERPQLRQAELNLEILLQRRASVGEDDRVHGWRRLADREDIVSMVESSKDLITDLVGERVEGIAVEGVGVGAHGS
ncbi:hypothetical protein CH063_01518 [Colletotrichum higginsianum]|uniref:Uncharacterized protein n=1 Tax=Colletotrichum higginsianum (strain IMI 349063) TaxID=759273 RepID=H1V8K4_COLHI|nr:hypothetical protein CH063_01518 [Colletotrichum higginsianum]